jgi:hypothetical protein
MLHKASMDRLKAGKFAEQVPIFDHLHAVATEMGAPEVEMRAKFLLADDENCAGEFAPSIIFLLKTIGPSED